MLRKTHGIKRLLKKTHDISHILDAYSGEDCYLITCGPSLNNYNLEKLKERLRDKLVICVKQAHHLFGEICDIHVSNFTNYMKTPSSGVKSIEIVGYLNHKKEHIGELKRLERIGKIDLKFLIKSGEKYRFLSDMARDRPDLLSSMMKNFINNKVAMNGPGIVYEVALPLAIAIGVKSITTIGWDIGPAKAGDKYEHFYDIKSRYSLINKRTKKKATVNHLKIRHEAKNIISGSKNYSNFLKDNGVELRILSKGNHAHSSIKRIRFEDL